MKDKTKKAKDKAKVKVAAKVGRKIGKTACVIAALALGVTGCATTGEQPARSQTMNNEFKGCVVVVAGTVKFSEGAISEVEAGEVPTVELFTQTQANDGSETISPSASPTNSPTTDTKLDIPLN